MNEQWFYIGSDGTQQGPVSKEVLISKGLSGNTQVWRDGMPNWQRIADIPELTATQYGGAPQYTAPQQQTYQQNNYNGSMNNSNVSGKKPENYLVWSILATIFCCLPFGIPSIIFASKVDNLYNQGNLQASQEASKKAKTWLMVSAICGALYWLAIIIMYAIYGVALFGAMSNVYY